MERFTFVPDRLVSVAEDALAIYTINPTPKPIEQLLNLKEANYPLTLTIETKRIEGKPVFDGDEEIKEPITGSVQLPFNKPLYKGQKREVSVLMRAIGEVQKRILPDQPASQLGAEQQPSTTDLGSDFAQPSQQSAQTTDVATPSQ